MDNIDKLKNEGYIISKSINAIAYVVYCCNAFVKVVEKDNGYKMFAIEDTETNRKFFSEYKNKDEEIYVNLRSYSRIIKMLKGLCKNY